MPGQQKSTAGPLYTLAAAVTVEIVGGIVVFTSDEVLLALALFVVGIVTLGVAGDALRKT